MKLRKLLTSYIKYLWETNHAFSFHAFSWKIIIYTGNKSNAHCLQIKLHNCMKLDDLCYKCHIPGFLWYNSALDNLLHICVM